MTLHNEHTLVHVSCMCTFTRLMDNLFTVFKNACLHMVSNDTGVSGLCNMIARTDEGRSEVTQ